jgi:hypothetical protein
MGKPLQLAARGRIRPKAAKYDGMSGLNRRLQRALDQIANIASSLAMFADRI